MTEERTMRLSQVARILNVGVPTVVSHLAAKGYKLDNNPNTKINAEQLDFLAKDFKSDTLLDGVIAKKVEVAPVVEPKKKVDDDLPTWFRGGSSTSQPSTPEQTPITQTKEKESEVVPTEPELIKAEAVIPGLKVLGKIDLNPKKKVDIPTPPPAPVEAKVVEVPKVETPVVAIPQVEVEPPKIEVPAVVEEVVKVEAKIIEPTIIEEVKPEPVAPVAKVEPEPVPTPVVEPVAVVKEEIIAPKIEVKVEKLPEPKVVVPTERPKTSEPKFEPRQDFKKKFDKEKEKPKQTPAVIDVPVEPELIEAKANTLKGLTILGKIQLPVDDRKNDSKANLDKKRKRKRLRRGEKVSEGKAAAPGTEKEKPKPDAEANKNKPKDAKPATTTNTNTNNNANSGKKDRKKERRDEVSQKDVDSSIKATFARLSSASTSGKNFGAGKRREKRKMRAEAEEERLLQEQEDEKVLKVTEFISANDLSSLMNVSVQQVIASCLGMGLFVSINQRLDAESITLIADEFGFDVQFISAEEEIEADITETQDDPEDLIERAPVVTIMGHVDHGKTSLLDYIRSTRVAAGEAGGITQHIGAYNVKTDDGRKITFLDTPGHEAFTAMRARGAKITDVVIIVIAADDSVMPQTREAINHAQLAGVPIVFAFSKVDKPGANTEKIRDELAQMNILVEEWGGKYQTQEISSKSGLGIPELLEKVLLEAEMLELKANPSRNANGTIIEASLDKGRGYMATILVQNGTLKVGDILIAGAHYGRVKAMFDSRGERMKSAPPSTPVLLLGLNGAPQAGDKFNVMTTEREAREIANKREQIIREQTIRTRKHITLEEIGRRKAIGTFKELNVIVKGDVDGSVEALSDSLLKLSTEEVQVNIIHKAVGQISESDINLAIASDAIVVGFQVRPSGNAKKLAEQEQIEIRLYSIIYDAINEVKDAMTGMLEPTVEEVITGNCEVREVFKITKVGTVAGCYVLDGSLKRNNKVRVIRDFIVIHEGDITALKRFKDDVSEVRAGFECGISIRGLNDILVGDIIEGFEVKEVKRTL